MAHVFKPTYTKPIPKNAERVKYKDGPAVRWKGRGNKWVTALVCEDNPDRCRVEGATWYIEYRDHEGNVQRAKGYADKAATEALKAELVRKSERISSGLLPPEAAQPRRTLTELIDKYIRYIVDNGSGDPYSKRCRQQITDVVAGIEAARPSDITPTAVLDLLGRWRTANTRFGKQPFGKTNHGHYLCAMKAFTRWLALVDKSEPVDHLSAVKRKQDDTDIRRQRRPLSPTHLDHLLETTRKSSFVSFGLTGPERATLYSVSSGTGLRAKELSSLRPESFDLDTCTVTIMGGRAKNKKTYTLPLADELVTELRALLKESPGGPIWPHRNTDAPTYAWFRWGARMIRWDLEAAGLPYKLNGKAFDFHALRGQFATDLDRANVTTGRAQKLMRLSNPSLLTKHYARPDQADLAADVNRIRKRKK